MIPGLDSSIQVPGPAQADAARAAGVLLWSGYIATRSGVGLYATWTQDAFNQARRCGADPIGFCSGWDDPVAIRQQAAAWRVKPCLDVESGIRDDGPWVQAWLDASGAGLYGLARVHVGRRAAFHVVARYPSVTPAPATWDPLAGPRPDAPCGWQWQGTHTEFGCSVDRGWYDDWFLAGADPAPRSLITSGGEGTLVLIPDPGEPGLHRFYIASPRGNVRWGWSPGGEGGFDSSAGGDIDVGGDGLLPGTLAVALHRYKGRYRFAVHALSGDGNVYQKVMDGPDRTVIEDWRPVPTAEPVLAPSGTPGPAGSDVRPEVADALEAAVAALRSADRAGAPRPLHPQPLRPQVPPRGRRGGGAR